MHRSPLVARIALVLAFGWVGPIAARAFAGAMWDSAVQRVRESATR